MSIQRFDRYAEAYDLDRGRSYLTLDVANGDGFTTQIGHALIVKCDDRGQTDLHRRAESAEARLARVEASVVALLDFLDEMWDGCEPGRGCTGCETKSKVTAVRAALAGES